MNSIFIGVALLVGIIGLYFLTYILNKNTDAPEGAIKVDKCSTCGTRGACSLSDREKQSDSDEECDLYETE